MKTRRFLIVLLLAFALGVSFAYGLNTKPAIACGVCSCKVECESGGFVPACVVYPLTCVPCESCP